jgi:ATP synthase protein I
MNKKNQIFRNIALISQLGINIMVPVFMCLLIGKGLDRLTGSSLWIIVMLVIGVLAGARSAYTTAMNSVRADEHKEEDPQDIVDRYNKEHGKGESNEKDI